MIAGVTGHQHFPSKDTALWVADRLREIVRTRRVTRGLTGLAVGADQLFARVLREAGVPYTAVIPSEGYEATFRDEAALLTYRTLLAGADDSVQLPFHYPSQEAFFAAGKRVVDGAQILFAIWDGESARGLGGTGDVVAYALQRGQPVVHVDVATRSVRNLTLSAPDAPTPLGPRAL